MIHKALKKFQDLGAAYEVCQIVRNGNGTILMVRRIKKMAQSSHGDIFPLGILVSCLEEPLVSKTEIYSKRK